MKTFIKVSRSSVLTLFLLIAVSCGTAVKAIHEKHAAKTLRVLIIGNSFSQNATRYLPQLVKEGGYRLELGRAEIGGCSLQTHWERAVIAEENPLDPKGKPYSGKSLKTLLSDGKWDVVTIQQYSRLSADPETYQPYANNLYSYIKKAQPDARITIHQTWAYRRDAKQFGFIHKEQEAKSDEDMFTRLRANYIDLARQLKVSIIPTGEAFWLMRNNPVWAFIPAQKTINLNAWSYPDLPPSDPRSLHVGYKWDVNKKLSFDSNHANNAGCYLGSLVWYHSLFGADLSTVSYVPENLDRDFATELRKAATNAFASLGQLSLQINKP